jgi:cell wall-associated NlpC family hydrolase
MPPRRQGEPVRRGGPLRLVQLAIAGAVLSVLAGVGITSASAVDGAAAACTGISATHGSAASTRAAIAKLKRCLQGLESKSEAAGRAAQRADERYLRAKAAAQSAGKELDRTRAGAETAADSARRSRARAGAVAMQLARGGSAGQAGNLLLDGRGASDTLYTMSRLSQLTADSHVLARQAAEDSATARTLQEQTAVKAQLLRRSSATAQAAFVTAKQESASVAAVVRSQRARVRHLQAQLAALTPPASASGAGSASSGVDLPPNASKAARAVAFARSQIGDPYVFAAAGPSSWDCSGLTMGAYQAVGVYIGIHSATAQYNYARSHGRLVSYADRRPGDLIFYTDGGGDMYHVTVYSGNGMMIEAPYEGADVREVPVRSHQLVGEVARPTA